MQWVIPWDQLPRGLFIFFYPLFRQLIFYSDLSSRKARRILTVTIGQTLLTIGLYVMVVMVVIEKAMVVTMLRQVFITDRVGIGKVVGLKFDRIVGMGSRVPGSCYDLLLHLLAAFDLLH